MAGTTSNGFPYPVNTDPVNIAVDIQNLATAVDTEVTDLLTPFLLMGA